ncbi:MAG: carbohydrate ABC transporter permease, partial [Fimbriimonadaceae bacterium]
MTRDLVFALGSICSWLGWGLFVATFWPGKTELNQRLTRAGLAVVALGVGIVLAPGKGTWGVPIFWPILPFSVWAIVASAILLVVSLIGLRSSVLRQEKLRRGRGAITSIISIAVFCLWSYLDAPIESRIVRGYIPVSADRFAIGLILVILACFGLGWATRTARKNRIAKGALTHLVLVGGSFVFALPLIFLLITSFKEDRDMSSDKGIIWIPRVQQTAAYRNPLKPIFDTRYQGVTVEVQVLEDLGNGRVRVDTNKPFSMRGKVFETERSGLTEVSKEVPAVTATIDSVQVEALVIEELEDGSKRLLITSPPNLANQQRIVASESVEPIRNPGLKWQNYPDALGMLPAETLYGWVYLRNTLVIVIFSVVGTILSSSLVAYAFSRLRFPGRDHLFKLLLGTMMLPGAVTLLPQFLIFRSLGWIDTLYPLWAPAFLGSAFNIFLLRQFFRGIPLELEDAAKIDGCSFFRTFWSVMMPQIKPALVVIFVWTFVGAWNNFMGPLIYINSPENMPLSYALQLFNG